MNDGMFNSKLKLNISLLFALVIPLILVVSWSNPEYMLAKAEEGIPLYSPDRTLDLLRYPYNEVGLGFGHAFHLPRVTFFVFNAWLGSLGFDGWTIQSIVFYLLLVTSFIIIPLLVTRLFPSSRKEVGIFTALFYCFNLFSLSQVWGRFLYPLFFLWSYLPLFLYLWIRYLDSGRLKDLGLFLMSSLVFSAAFGLPASVFAVFAPSVLYSVFKLFLNKDLKKVLARSLTLMVLWMVVNFWWIYPLYSLADTSYTSYLEQDKSFTSLTEVSKYFPSRQLLLLKQGYLFDEKSVLHELYVRDGSVLLSMLVLFIVILGVLIVRKEKIWLYLVALFIASWYIVKGANPPLGESFYKIIYSYFPLTQSLRNPYEKFGVVFLLTYSIFFATGLSFIVSFFGRKRVIAAVMILLFVIFYLPLPLWTKMVFGNGTYIRVPGYYQSINELLIGKQDGRILHTPFLSGSGLKYSWGYDGEDPSDYLFVNSSISRILSLPKLDDYYLQLGKSIKNGNFSKLLMTSNVKFIVNHKDRITSPDLRENVDQARSTISHWKGVSFVDEVGELELYELGDQLFLERVYAADEILWSENTDEVISVILSNHFDPKSDVVFARTQNKGDPTMIPDDLATPKLSFTKHNPGRYKVILEGVTKPFVLVLSNNYDHHWVAEIEEVTLSGHFEVNGFANGWVVERLGTYNIDLKYKVYPWD